MEKLWKANLYQLQSKKLKWSWTVTQGLKSIFLLNSFFYWSNRVCNIKLILFFCLTSSGLEVRQGSYKWHKFKKFRQTLLKWFSLANRDRIQRNQLLFFVWRRKIYFHKKHPASFTPFPPRSSPCSLHLEVKHLFLQLNFPWHLLIPDLPWGRASKWGRELQNPAARWINPGVGCELQHWSCSGSIQRKGFALFGEAKAFTHKSKPLGLLLSRCEKGCCEDLWPRKELGKPGCGGNTELGLGSWFGVQH